MPEVFVAGVPAPQGSKTRLAHGAIVESSRKVGEWRSRVALAVQEALDGAEPTSLPVYLRASFLIARPKSHLTATGNLRKGAPLVPGRPDLDKLARAVLDALTGVLYLDDGQVTDLDLTKSYDQRPGVELHWELWGADV